MNRWWVWAAMALVLVAAFAVGVTDSRAPRTESDRVAAIAAEVRCPTCQSLSAAESDAPAAQAVRDEIRTRLRSGESKGEILSYLASRYGDSILLRPEAGGVAGLVWALPVVAALLAVIGVGAAVRRWRATTVAGTGGAPSDDDRALVEAALRFVTDDELRAQRDALLQSLRDLEDEHAAGDLADADYLTLKEEYTSRAASVLRQLQADPLPGANPLPDNGSRPEAAVVDRRTRRLRTIAVLGLLAIVSGGIGFAVAQSSGERLAGDEATGDLPENGVDRITKANVLVSEGKVLEAVKLYDQVLDDDPKNPVALAQRGWLISRVDPRLVDDGLAQVDRAIALDPTYADAHFFRGMILLRAKDQPAAAAESFQHGIEANPDPDLLSILRQFKAEAEEAAAAPTTAPTPSTTP